ncbi:unnamed protein product, partial [Dicrocoelium dendriticum]
MTLIDEIDVLKEVDTQYSERNSSNGENPSKLMSYFEVDGKGALTENSDSSAISGTQVGCLWLSRVVWNRWEHANFRPGINQEHDPGVPINDFEEATWTTSADDVRRHYVS